MGTPAQDIGLHLAGIGLGSIQASDGWSINLATEPAKPDDTITLYDYGGRDALLYGRDLRQPSVQVRVRSREYLAGYAKHTEIVDALHDIIDRDIDGHRYVGIWQIGDIQSIGRDDNNRYVMTANYQITRESIAQEA